jgi:hypothetical protein
MATDAALTEGTELAPTFYEGPADVDGDVQMHQRYYTYRSPEGLVAGKTASVMFTVDRPARDVWPFLKDFNLWQNAYDHFYSGVAGDLEGQRMSLSLQAGPFKGREMAYDVIRTIPEHLIVLSQPTPEEPGAVSPGFHVFMLNEHGGKTVVTVIMQHAALTQEDSDAAALATWRELAPDSQMKWREIFVPTLKQLIEGRVPQEESENSAER